MKVSDGSRPGPLRDVLGAILRSYGAPLGIGLLCVLAALYIFAGKANRSAPDFPRTPSQFMEASKIQRRLAELQAVLAANPEDMRALAESGGLKYQLGPAHYIEAIADLEKARALGVVDVRMFYYLGGMYQAVGLYEFASQEYRKFLNNFPNDAEVGMLQAKLCYASGDFVSAARGYETLLKSGKTDPVLLENLALALWKSGQDYAKPLSDLRKQGGGSVFLADYVEGTINYEQKNYDKAADLLKKAAAAPSDGEFPDRAGLLWMAGDAAYKAKDTVSASSLLRELLRISPTHAEGRSLLSKLEKADNKVPAKKKKQHSK